MDDSDRYYRDALQNIREQYAVTKWSDGIPVSMVAVRDYGNVLCICHFLPFGFECATCGLGQQIHEGKCNGCGAELVVKPNWPAYHQMLHERELNLHRMERDRRYG